MSVRFTVTSEEGAISFVAPAYAIKMFVAACARDPESIAQFLEFSRRYDQALVNEIKRGLDAFNEHNLPDNTAHIEALIESTPNEDLPPFRIYNEKTRLASSQSGVVGMIIFNLNARRIVQVQNSYAEIQRSDRGRLRDSGEPLQRLYHYTLPDEWAIVP